MKNSTTDIPVVIVGGGPVGLFLAICLLKKGIHCKILEKRDEPVPDSRSLGIHPVSLELFDKIDLTQPFLDQGLKIQKGFALSSDKVLGEINFEGCPKPHNYILACPQFTTEAILRKELNRLDDSVLVTKAEFKDLKQKEDQVEIYFTDEQGNNRSITADFVIGCDGKNSPVRQRSYIHYSGKRYDDTYIMGDFGDNTDFGSDAAVYLLPDGLIECFPLPNGRRRWVVKTDSYVEKPDSTIIVELVRKRINHDLKDIQNVMISSFGGQHFIAETFAKGRVILAGDAAHVVSPIGGQGMNLGWLDAWRVAEVFAGDDIELNLKEYSESQKKITRKVARRAELNMALGRKTAIPSIRNLLIKSFLKKPLKNKIAQLFTMRGLESWWI
ncbi:FAD-dependent oxidoreductase [Gracilimonas amylolytica]|uniref:FAD-dependent oxidoreductase n=1 Tax=Gracilimonas amylolytica TaxID=1749045 RepID=UPI000CD8FD49|nr:NAD(P)/FAD-dependent oxidoreductase [Gracilimonas amylolytica]